ncbi:MAG: FAD-binding oxidoreductase [Phycisphaerae bacterium]|jgi:Na+-transporting NADH:ubiquinone oxidoreductase subunit F|nr:FAD-binding oxidoreductase [Phycisphaerae bacterium]
MDVIITVLLATAAASGLTAVLAALLLLAERVLVNYGPCAIDINSGERGLDVIGGKPLLTTLMEEDIFIPSACGGRGTCAYCKLQILEGGGAVTPTEEPLLTPEEIADNVRISCQVKVRNDLAVLIPEELFLVKQYRGRVERIIDLTYDIKQLRISLIEPDTIEFLPGQYIQLQAPAYKGNPEPVYRAYSMSSPPSDPNAVETIIRLVPGGICTTWVFTKLAEGDEVIFSGPYGDFHLSESDAEMIWIAGGSGMAPFWSMLRYMKEHDIRRKCTYFFGAVHRPDLFLLDELHQLEAELDWFTFIPALSAEGECDDGVCETGLITEVVDRHIGDASHAEAYLCGSPGMIDAAVKVLRAKGVVEERTYYDKFA